MSPPTPPAADYNTEEGGAGGMGGAGGIAELDDDDRKLGFLLKAGVDGLRLAENMVAREVVKLAGEEVVTGGVIIFNLYLL
jgi:hypothetical protein